MKIQSIPAVLIPDEVLMNKIFLIRGVKIMIDSDLAVLYEVPTKRLNEQVKRNMERFPDPLFMFQLTKEEWESLRSQNATLKNEGRGKQSKYLPFAFTELGVAMLSSVLNSKRAIQVNIQIIILFKKMREMIEQNSFLRKKIESLERKYQDQDDRINEIFFTLKKLMEPPAVKKPRKEIGFHTAIK